ncbi:Ig-like domain-containing protein [Pontibacter pudoricolor]|uniref:Ig-like domain-containing protein n=1 Tax=Pontibacter pudoricolor TaxID=2694930 RepID=UPI001390FD17|nr:Ig-like domain-containing protein [Pontibacter pudoricolor]
MRNKLSILLLSLFTVIMFSGCEDELESFDGPYQITIRGAASALPETTKTYSLGNIQNPENYTWTVEGPAQIVGATTGATVTVKFVSAGDVRINVTNGVDKGLKTVSAIEATADVTAKLTDTGVLRSGQSDTVFFNFAVPVEGMPTLELLDSDEETDFNKGEPFLSGSIGELKKIDATHFFAIYTAGEGNGTPEAKLSNIKSTAAFGSKVIETEYVQLYRVDNIAPVANISYSTESVKTGSPVTITVTFSEPVMNADPKNKKLFMNLNGTGTSETVELKPTSNNRVYTYEFTPKTTSDGVITVSLNDIVDLAGNSLNGVNNATALSVDNVNPVVTGTAVDAGNYASITLSSTEAGTVSYVILKTGSTAPTAATFASTTGVAKGSVEITSANQQKIIAQDLAKGEYVVYFMAADKAGNTSAITSDALSMN